MKAKGMAKDYQALFGGLAKEFDVTLVAGSIVLPEPSVIDGTLKIGRGALYNSSVVFGRDGLPIGQPQRQMHPVFEQQDAIKANGEHTLNVVDTPAGRLGVLIGSDSWYPDNYRKLDSSAGTDSLRCRRSSPAAAPGINRGVATRARRRRAPSASRPVKSAKARPGIA